MTQGRPINDVKWNKVGRVLAVLLRNDWKIKKLERRLDGTYHLKAKRGKWVVDLESPVSAPDRASFGTAEGLLMLREGELGIVLVATSTKKHLKKIWEVRKGEVA